MMRKISALGLLFTILTAITVTSVSAEVYKWKDKEGNVHFSQTPRDADSTSETYDLQYNAGKNKAYPDSSDKKKVETLPSTLSPEERIAAMEKEQQEQAKKAEESARVAAEKKANCGKAQNRMAVVKQGGRVYEIDKNGQRVYWDDATRKAKQLEAQGFIDTFCE